MATISNLCIEDQHVNPLSYMAKDIAKCLGEEEVVKAYFAAKKAFDEDLSLKEINAKISAKQKEMMDFSAKNDTDNYEKAKAEYLKAKQSYDGHPLVNNLLAAQDDLEPLLKEVEARLK